ncbi:MAG: Na+:solute symporter [Bacteroidia bacterium]|nr:MAG: Na+:solute symporter [Bacteroidia bacterium]
MLQTIDWIIVGIFFIIVLGIGWTASKTAGKNTTEFFLGGRGMPWWLLGISMVACTFSADTPNLVTGMVRENGVAKNWAWWAFLITGMVTVFIYAKLWRRSNVMTDLEYYELRYSGKAASFLRGFRSIYLGVFFNTLIMGTVTLAAIKIGGVMLGIPPWMAVVGGSVVVVIYASLGGLKGVIWADFFQYSIAMFGAVLAAVVAVKQPEIGGLGNLLTHPAVKDSIKVLPDFGDPSVWVPLLIIPIAVQWWAVWYPGAEPGGGGYIAQRMLSAKDEKNAIGATLLFNFAHYALRPWPWIIVALASMVIFPDLASIKEAFPNIADTYLKDDIAYPAMLTKLGPGWIGLVTASIIAAYMSTIGTHLNWGSSYVVNDFYRRFVKPDAEEKQLVAVARLTTILLMVIAGLLALFFLNNATQAFNILILSGAGTGAIYLLRWFWWRINAWTEIVAMFGATIIAIVLVVFVSDEALGSHILDPFSIRLLIAVGVTTLLWLVTTLVTGPESNETLYKFYRVTHPGGPGWKKVVDNARKEGILFPDEGKKWEMPLQVLCVFIGTIVIYSSLFSIGSFVYGKHMAGIILSLVAAGGTIFLFKSFKRLSAG